MLLAALALWAAAGQAQPAPSLQELTAQARAAREGGNYPAYLKSVEAIRDVLPRSPSIQYSMARAYALNGRTGDALSTLEALAAAGWGFDPTNDPALASLKNEARFGSITTLLARNASPAGGATLWRKLPLAGRQPEGIAAARDGRLFVGALKDGIYRIEASGLAKVYAPEPGWGVVGLRVDTPRAELIACLSDEAAGKGRLLRLALPAGEERSRVDLPAPGAFCNDSTVLPDGRVALTDSTGGRLWIADRTTAREVKLDRPLVYPNGVAFSGRRLFVAHAGGLRIVDPESGRSQDVTAASTSLSGIDGLIADRGVLYAVQNGTVPVRVLRITRGSDTTASVDVLASGHAILAGATTAALHQGRLLVLTQTGIPNGSQPDDPILVEVPIRRQ